ncbi:hypothetical protein EMEDMD4_1070018 [Sinorhizobium medicae]|uniref:Uncharacterized protein n=1 Tax=Sinorhizobium medicae TaxID=110321 RepID=A0A508WPK2_9HYPH|nr:hypothetical protein EMEDMD4_1070018 [Sinorhizobium medicae]
MSVASDLAVADNFFVERLNLLWLL